MRMTSFNAMFSMLYEEMYYVLLLQHTHTFNIVSVLIWQLLLYLSTCSKSTDYEQDLCNSICVRLQCWGKTIE